MTSSILMSKKIAIIGFGASGIACFYNIVKQANCDLSIDIFEKNIPLTKGPAYSTKNFHHLLNVEANHMSLEISDPNDFLSWLKKNNYDYQEKSFAPRILFGKYLEEIIARSIETAESKGIKYNLIKENISEIKKQNNNFLINGNAYETCILAIGIDLKNSQKNFWNDDIKKYLDDEEIHIAGTGLTAVDAIISLIDENYCGKIFAHSRSGLITMARSTHEVSNSPLSIADMNLPLSQIFHKFVRACKNNKDWQCVMDSVRNITQELWQKLDSEKKKRFKRHCLKYWNIHRHRCPQEQFAKLEKLLAEKKLFFTTEKLPKKFIDCTGFDFNFSSDLVKNLVAENLVKYDDLKMGIISNSSNLHIIGGANFGALLETTAIPEIAVEANNIAQKIYTHSHAEPVEAYV